MCEHLFVYREAEPQAPDGLSDIPLEHLEHEITRLAAHINAGTCRWLDLVAEFDRRNAFASWGCRSTAEWVAWRCAVAPRSAREHVRVARRLHELPGTRAAFARGELSYAKVRAITRVATEESEGDLLEMATHATAAQLERIVRACRKVTAEEADDAHANRYFVHSWDPEDGSFEFRGRVPAEEGALILRALDAARDSLWEERREQAAHERSESRHEGAEARAESGSAEPPLGSDDGSENGSAEPPPCPRPTNADCLSAVAEASLAAFSTASPARAGPERHQVVVHVEAEAIARDGDGSCHLEDGPALAPETARRLACDSSLVHVLESGGEPLAVGRRTRTVPTALRRALQARDPRCSFPGCENRRFLDAHHLRHWAHGGETSLRNLIHLCRQHHRLIHEGVFDVRRARNGDLVFTDPSGARMGPAPALPASSPAELDRDHTRAGLAIGPGSLRPGGGEKLDLALAVDGLVARGAGRAPG